MKPQLFYRTKSEANLRVKAYNTKHSLHNNKLSASNSNYIENILSNSINDYCHDGKFNCESYYEKMLFHFDLSKDQLENKIGKAVQQLNSKEVQIYQILKGNLDKFKDEVTKYEQLYNESTMKSNGLEGKIKLNQVNELTLYNITFMTLEDCNSHYNEISLLQEEAKGKIKQMKEMELSHPKEYKFMQEEFQLENESRTLTSKLKENKEVIKRSLKHQEEVYNEKDRLIKEIGILKSNTQSNMTNDNRMNRQNSNGQREIQSINIVNEGNSHSYDNDNDNDLSSRLNVSEIIQALYSEDYNEKNKDMYILSIEKSILKTKMNLMKAKKAEMDQIQSIEKRMREISLNINNEHSNRHLKELQLKHNTLTNDCNILSQHITQIENIFNKNSSLLNKYKQSIDKDKDNEPNINQLRSLFQREILSDYLSPNDTKSHSTNHNHNYNTAMKTHNENNNTITVINTKENNSYIQTINTKIDQINNELIRINNEVTKLHLENTTITNSISILKSKIEEKNNNLKINLKTLGEEKFNMYIETNETALKNMKNIYGNKVLNKVFKQQKTKFLEGILDNHLTKRGKVNESIGFIVRFNNNVTLYQCFIESSVKVYHELYQQYEKCLEEQRTLAIEKKIIDESNKDLKEEIEEILKEQIKEVKKEKQRLQKEFNTHQQIETIAKLKIRIQNLMKKKIGLGHEYNSIKREYNEMEAKNSNYNNKGNSTIMHNSNISQSIIGETGASSIALSLTNNNTSNNSKCTKLIKGKKDINVVSIINLSKQYITDFHQSTLDKSHNTQTNNNNNNTSHPSKKITFHKSKSYTSIINQSNLINNKDNKAQIHHLQSQTNRKSNLLSSGLSLYIKFDNTTMNYKQQPFDPLKSNQYPPESCGYVLRYFKLNQDTKEIEIKQMSYSARLEFKIHIKTILDIFPSNQSIKSYTVNNQSSSSLTNEQNSIKAYFNETYLFPFTLVSKDKRLSLIAPSQSTYNSFINSIKELIANSKCNSNKNRKLRNTSMNLS